MGLVSWVIGAYYAGPGAVAIVITLTLLVATLICGIAGLRERLGQSILQSRGYSFDVYDKSLISENRCVIIL